MGFWDGLRDKAAEAQAMQDAAEEAKRTAAEAKRTAAIERDPQGKEAMQLQKQQAKEAKQLQKQESARSNPVTLGWATYLGGVIDQPKKRSGNLMFTVDGIILERGPGLSKVSIPMSDVCGVDVGGEQVGKSRVGAVLAFGVLGLGAKSSVARGELTVYLKSGGEAYFHVDKKSEMEIKGALSPLLGGLGIPFGNEAAAPVVAAPSGVSTADELAKLAQLRDQGVLTEEEFAAHKAKLLG